ncbi:MAG: FCD domain-containing protein, partial [Anaerolineae bacterium]|nr:FCD domain-containing protein [Anaerolineae bacterium]
MELVRVDTQRAYEIIWEKITTLALAPGTPINEQQLAEELEMGVVPVREAIRLLAHENLVEITPRHGLYVADVNVEDLEYISEIRLSLEALCARLAAQRAAPDDLVVLEALRQEQASLSADVSSAGDDPAQLAEASRRLFDLDHRFHRTLAHAARNKYLAQTLERLFGLSRRLWYLALPHMGYLPAAVGEHLQLIEAIEAGDADRASRIMHDHVEAFYAKVHETLVAQGQEEGE